ncbi:aldehyde dehydrogenase family protein, partial [Ideonella sp.]|uniref:aldehyde dehydrogenase family protein n=1 Tax=Ideonella sp. TaxID=1929293 RepID=UPI0035AF24EF
AAAWAARPVAERAAWLRDAAGRLGDGPVAAAWRRLAERAAVDLAPQDLPGPTGESNRLRLHGRGVALFVGGAAPAEPLAAALAAALVAGNGVVWSADPAGAALAAPWLSAWSQAGLPAGLLQVMQAGAAPAAALVAAPGVAVVCATRADALPALSRQLAGLDGPIVPLLGLGEAGAGGQLYRWCAEQTVTINTAAAGGNAALLAGVPAGGV